MHGGNHWGGRGVYYPSQYRAQSIEYDNRRYFRTASNKQPTKNISILLKIVLRVLTEIPVEEVHGNIHEILHINLQVHQEQPPGSSKHDAAAPQHNEINKECVRQAYLLIH